MKKLFYFIFLIKIYYNSLKACKDIIFRVIQMTSGDTKIYVPMNYVNQDKVEI